MRPASACLPAFLFFVACSSGGGAGGAEATDGGGDAIVSPPSDTGPSSNDGATTTSGGDPLGDPKPGVATFYTFADGTGACGFDASPNDLDIAALGANQWDGSAACGGCYALTGPKGTVTVRIVDECPDCNDDWHFDLSPSAFAKIDDTSAGRTAIQWQAVTCNVTGPIEYKFKEGSNQWWTAIQLRNHRLPIKSLEAFKNGAWETIQRLDYNYFVDASGLGVGPYKLRVTDSLGAQLEDDAITPGDGIIVPGAGQFP